MQWRIPLADVVFGEAERAAVQRALDSGWITMGPETELFEQEMADYIGVEHAIAVSSGTAALHLALLALGINQGDEVIVPALTFVATANAVRHAGGVPVFADITSLTDWNIHVDRIEEKITTKTKAIIVVHYAGFPCAMDEIRSLAAKHRLRVIEDAAHAPGAEHMGRRLGAIGDAGCFSFFSNKNMTTAEGGMVTTHNAETAERLRLLRCHGMSSLTWDRHRGKDFSYDVVVSGYNYRIDEIRSALGRVQLRQLDRKNADRREMTEQLRGLLQSQCGMTFPFTDSALSSSACHIFPVLLPRPEMRWGFMESMKRMGIQTSIHYPAIHHLSAYASCEPRITANLELTEEVARREVTLPLFADMRTDQAYEIAAAVGRWVEQTSSRATSVLV